MIKTIVQNAYILKYKVGEIDGLINKIFIRSWCVYIISGARRIYIHNAGHDVRCHCRAKTSERAG